MHDGTNKGFGFYRPPVVTPKINEANAAPHNLYIRAYPPQIRVIRSKKGRANDRAAASAEEATIDFVPRQLIDTFNPSG